MALKMYRKLEFGSTDKLEDEASSNTETDKEEEQAIPSPPPDHQSGATLITNGVPSPSSSPTSPPPCSSADKSLIVTRDYYSLADTVGGNHSCVIFFTNGSMTTELRDPIIFTKKGYTRIPPDSKIPPNSNSYCAFRKPSIAIKGTSGVISYEYDRKNGRSKRFAVMWKIPYRVINHEENQVS